MKVYCSICEKVQPVIIDNCRDARTNELFQDIVCKECHLVIAAGTDIQRQWVGLTDEDSSEIGQQANRFDWLTDYSEAIDFVIEKTEAKLREKNL